MAEGGSLLLDEIGEMPPYLQTKLLRVLQEREYRPIGSDRIVRVDFRLICATNIDLDAALRDGKLREDLYFRINTITLRVPPLRERTEDIPLLCEHFLEKYRQRHQRNVKSIAPAAYHVLIRHRWPGNVRELENVIERGVLVAKGTEITVNDLPESLRTESATTTEFVIPPHRTLAEIEKMAILQTLQRTNWNKQEAAQILGLYRPTLYSKMKKHEIQDGGKGAARGASLPVSSSSRPESAQRPQPCRAHAARDACSAAGGLPDRDAARLAAVGDVVALRLQGRPRALGPAFEFGETLRQIYELGLPVGATHCRFGRRRRRRAVDAHACVARALRRRVDDPRGPGDRARSRDRTADGRPAAVGPDRRRHRRRARRDARHRADRRARSLRRRRVPLPRRHPGHRLHHRAADPDHADELRRHARRVHRRTRRDRHVASASTSTARSR